MTVKFTFEFFKNKNQIKKKIEERIEKNVITKYLWNMKIRRYKTISDSLLNPFNDTHLYASSSLHFQMKIWDNISDQLTITTKVREIHINFTFISHFLKHEKSIAEQKCFSSDKTTFQVFWRAISFFFHHKRSIGKVDFATEYFTIHISILIHLSY